MAGEPLARDSFAWTYAHAGALARDPFDLARVEEAQVLLAIGSA